MLILLVLFMKAAANNDHEGNNDHSVLLFLKATANQMFIKEIVSVPPPAVSVHKGYSKLCS